MSSFERIERHMPELMSELAPASVPDYFDDMLRQTGRARQRPAWASLERWLPMDVVARPSIVRAPPLRPILILLLVGLLLAAGLLVYAGSRRVSLPEPFGLARNGVIVLGTSDEDIVRFDPSAGSTTTLLGGPTRDMWPVFARDGSKFVFVRATTGDVGASWIANADGTDAHELVPGPVDEFQWSDSGDRAVVTRPVDGSTQTTIVETDSGASTLLDIGDDAEAPSWRPGHDQIMFKTTPLDGPAYHLVDADGSNERLVQGVAAGVVTEPQFSPDGSQLTYASWGESAISTGRIHVLDIDTGADRVLMFDGSLGSEELNPRFSPDGTSLVFERYIPNDGGYHLVVASLDGSGSPRALGPRHATGTNGAAVQFSPDGTQVLAVYNDDGAAWLLDVDGSGEQQLSWSEAWATWQRLAP